MNFLTFTIQSFRQFFARTYRFATIKNVTDRRQTDDRQIKARPTVRSAKNHGLGLYGAEPHYSMLPFWQLCALKGKPDLAYRIGTQ